MFEGYDHSAETLVKNADFCGILEMHLGITRNLTGSDCPYQYMDLNAGPGRYQEPTLQRSLWQPPDEVPMVEIIGSPVIFLKTASKAAMPYRAVLFESNRETRECLQTEVATYPNVSIHGDHDTAVDYACRCDRCRGYAYGLIYSDETGRIPPFDLLGSLAHLRRLRTVDLLIYYSATNHKRVRRAQGGPALVDHLRAIEKQHWVVREPHKQHQWTFLIGTNWGDFPEWQRRGFYRVESPIGLEILELLNYSKSEIAA